MFEKLKNIINRFFYKEIEDDETQSVLSESNKHPRRSLSNEKTDFNRSRIRPTIQNQERSVSYHYPKRQDRQFKFPLIGDTESKHNKPLTQKSNDGERKNNSRLTKTRLNHKRYQAKELEDVPSLTRKTRRKSMSTQPSVQPSEIQTSDIENKPNEKIIPIYTKPEELDRVFSKRDGKFPKKVDAKKIIKPSSEQRRKVNKTIETTVQQADVPPELMKNNKAKEVASLTHKPANSIKETENKTLQFEKHSENDHRITHSIKTVPHHLLDDVILSEEQNDDDWLIEQQILLEDAFVQFNIEATVVDVKQGPSITQFEIRPSKGVKVSKIRNLSDDLKLHLSAKEIRIEAPIPGKNTIGIEIPNKNAKLVYLQQLIETKAFARAESPLTIALGLTIDGEPLITNINKMPHGLIAGATGSGKSVCINTIILSILYKASHEDVKLLLIDPKMVELTPYNNIPHLITPVITDVKAATKSLQWAVQEMEHRYQKFVELGVRNIDKYNEKINKLEDNYEKIAYIVIIIDELSDLMMMSPQEVEDAICRIAQKARACGIHLLLATQRPSVDVITGLIKANIPTRIAFSVSSQVDSRTMLDQSGAEKLLGKGDMLFLENGAKTLRLQGPFVSDEEIERVTDYVKQIAEPIYLFEEEQLLHMDEKSDEDELMRDVLTFVLEEQQASTSLLQRRFRIGYNRAARLIDSLENQGIVSSQNGSKPREVLVTKDQISFEH